MKKKELEEYVDARNAMRVAVSRKYTKELKESLEGTSNDTKALRSIKKAMIKNHEAPFDISENGKKLPPVLLSALLDKIKANNLLPKLDDFKFTAEEGYSKMKVNVPCKYVETKDIMNVLFSMVFEEIKKSKNDLQAIANLGDLAQIVSGVREINANRLEIYMQSGAKNGTGTIEYVLKKLVEPMIDLEIPFDYPNEIKNIIECMINHANFHANQISGSDSILKYENHTIIVTFEPVVEQDAHVDLDDLTTHQFGFLMSPKSPLTHHYLPINNAPYLKPRESLRTVWKDIDDDLNEILCSNEYNRDILDKYGKVLTRPTYKDGPGQKLFPVGTTCCLAAREVHGGPKTEKPRAIMFFTGRPIRVGKKYDSERQYCCTTLISDLIVTSWLQMAEKDRQWLLMKWWEDGLKHDNFGILQVTHKHCKVMGEAIKKSKNREKLIQSMAKSKVWNEDIGRERWTGERVYTYTPKET